jgi:LacI family transcriptional regulator
MTVTIRDVAKALNLSITTVSRALDGYDDVAEETRERVFRMAKEMGYVPNRVARQLRRQRSDTLGYILPAHTPRFSDPFYSEFVAGLGDETAEQNFDLLISTAAPKEESERVIYQKWVQGRRVDGFILNRMLLQDWRVQYLAENNVPFVTFERTLDPFEFNFIEVDGQAGFVELLAHLVEMGHRRIGYVGGPSYLTLQASRFAGYRTGLLNAGIEFVPELVAEGNMTRAGGYQTGKMLLDLPEPPTAIACVNDLTAIGVVRAAQERGLKVGHDLAVAGFDGIEEAEQMNPALTTLAQPIYDIARRLVRMLLQEISGDEILERRVRLKPKLLMRNSTTH